MGTRREKSISEMLDDIDIKLTACSKAAAGMGDDMLVYLLDMAILHVRKKAVHLVGAAAIRSTASNPLTIAAQ